MTSHCYSRPLISAILLVDCQSFYGINDLTYILLKLMVVQYSALCALVQRSGTHKGDYSQLHPHLALWYLNISQYELYHHDDPIIDKLLQDMATLPIVHSSMYLLYSFVSGGEKLLFCVWRREITK